MDKIGGILVPVAGHPIDEEAVQLACRMAKATKGRVYTVYVIEVTRTLPLNAEIEPDVRKGEAVLDRVEQLAEELDFEVESELLQAREVGPAVVDEAIERGVDLIVLGVPYKKRFGEFNLGKVAPYVLKNAPCRVWLVRQAISEIERS